MVDGDSQTTMIRGHLMATNVQRHRWNALKHAHRGHYDAKQEIL